ncbi:MAG: hypothetical protein KC708_03060 [Anaerolineae bacterium]|nr:hypothetical protein [Anaerolineae bacterium]
MRRFALLIVLIASMTVLAACGGASDDTSQSAGDGGVEQGVVHWPRDPQFILFRAEVIGGDGSDTIVGLNNIPRCSIYGDGRIVWTVPNQSGFEDVRFDYLSDEVIIDFVNFLVVTNRFYTYDAVFERTVPTVAQPVYEKLSLNVNDSEHSTDAFAEWPSGFYSDIVERCGSIAPTPRIFEPQGAWLTTEIMEYNPQSPTEYWEPEASGLNLADASDPDSKLWLEGSNVLILWDVMRTNPPDIQFNQNGMYYQLALQVPGVTINAPLAPAQ